MIRAKFVVVMLLAIMSQAHADDPKEYYAKAKELGLAGCVRALDFVQGVWTRDTTFTMWRIPNGVAIAVSGLPVDDKAPQDLNGHHVASGTVVRSGNICIGHRTIIRGHATSCQAVIDGQRASAKPDEKPWRVLGKAGVTTWIEEKAGTRDRKSVIRLLDSPRGACIEHFDIVDTTNAEDGQFFADMWRGAMDKATGRR